MGAAPPPEDPSGSVHTALERAADPSRIFFDWYAGTTREKSLSEVDAALRERFPEADYERCSGRNGYLDCYVLRDRAGERICEVLTRGNPGVHVVSSGDYSGAIAEVLRQGRHRVTRADAAIDLVRAGAFNKLSKAMLRFALEKKLTITQIGDWERGKSRTLYLGSRRSPVMWRLYEKGYKEGADPRWVRLEVEVKPKGEKGFLVAEKSPYELFSACRWSTELAALLRLPEATRFAVGTVRTLSTKERARLALAQQYGPVLRDWLQQASTDERFLAELRMHLRVAERGGEPHEQLQHLHELGLVAEDSEASRARLKAAPGT